MDWLKLYNDEVLYNEYAPRDYIAILKFRALFHQFEREPKNIELKHFLTSKQIEFVRKTCVKDTENILNLLKENEQKRKNDKKRKASRQQKSDNFQSESETNPNGFPIIEREREVLDKSNTKEEERERENRRASPHFPFFPYSKYPDIDPVLIQDLKSKFDLLWGCWLNTRRGTQQDAKDSYERVANETGLNEFADRLEIAFGMYMRSEEWDKEIVKSLPKWIPEFANWEEEYFHQLKDKRTKPLEKGKTWERMKEHVESERK